MVYPMHEYKHSETYLHLIDDNTHEKTSGLQSLLSKHKQGPVVELGVGGGEGVRQLAANGANVIACDLLQSILQRIECADNICRVVCSGIALPFKNTSIEGINASALMHEVFTFAGGLNAVYECLSEISRVLLPGGWFLYRDIYLPQNIEFEELIEIHPKHSLFRMFLGVYCLHNNLFRRFLKQDGDLKPNVALRLPAFAAADLLNHYLYFRKVACAEFSNEKCLWWSANLSVDSFLSEEFCVHPRTLQRLVSYECPEQYIYLDSRLLKQYMELQGFIVRAEKWSYRSHYRNYLQSIGLPSLGGAKLLIQFQKTED